MIRFKDMVDGYNISYTENRLGVIDSALSLNDGYTVVPGGHYFNDNFTILVWIKIISNFSWHRLLDFGDQQNLDFVRINLSNNNEKISFRIFNSKKNININLNSKSNLLDKQWYHLGFIYKKTKISIYINGNEDNYQNFSENVFWKPEYRKFCYFGKRIITSSSNLTYGNFVIDEIKFFDNELVDSEVKSEFNFGYH